MFLRRLDTSVGERTARFKAGIALGLAVFVLWGSGVDEGYGMSRRENKKKVSAGSKAVSVSAPVVAALKLTSVGVKDGARYNEGEKVKVSVGISGGSGSVEYQYSVDGVVKQGWCGKGAWEWNSQPGLHKIKVEVRAVGTGLCACPLEIEVFVYRQPVR